MTDSRQEAKLFAELDGLGASAGAELVEDAAGVGLDGVFADEELSGNLAVAHALGDELKDFQLAGSDAEGFAPGLIDGEGSSGWDFDLDFKRNRDFADDYGLAGTVEAVAQPDAEDGEDGGDEAGVELEGVLDDEKAVLAPFEEGDEETAGKSEDEDVALHDAVGRSISLARTPAHAYWL
jgi:hypothetical protein